LQRVFMCGSVDEKRIDFVVVFDRYAGAEVVGDIAVFVAELIVVAEDVCRATFRAGR